MTPVRDQAAYVVEEVTLPAQHTLVVRGEVAEVDIADFLARAFTEVARVAAGDGMPLNGPPFARVHVEPDGTMDVEAGFPVAGVLLGQGEVKASLLPGGSAVRTLHRGAYERTREAHAALHAYAAAHRLLELGDAWEVYLDDPDVPQPRTMVVLPTRTDATAADRTASSSRPRESAGSVHV